MTHDPAELVEETAHPPRRGSRWRRITLVCTVLALLFGVPWWTLVLAPAWPTAITVAGTVLVAAALIGLPTLLFIGHGRHRDLPAAWGDALLGAIWVVFVWSIPGSALQMVLKIGGADDALWSRVVAGMVIATSATLLIWGYLEAMRVPRIRSVEVRLRRLGPGLDGLRVAMITDTHYGPINRARWSAAVVDRVNRLDADIVCHVGDIADGTVAVRLPQAAPLSSVTAPTRVYVTGNHEYFHEAQDWLDYMAGIGWDVLHNRHLIVERGGDRLVVAGVDDDTAAASGVGGHGQDLATALTGADPALPVLLLAHQPKQIRHAAAAGVDLQISGHTHGGQIWPFHLLVRLDQPGVQGLSEHGDVTQLYTSRGTGFWGPPFRVFAPSEITLLTLRTAPV